MEDDEDTRQLLAMALQAQGYQLSEASRGDEALECLRQARYDLVITDYDLPGQTGAATLREANAQGLLKGTATQVVTAHPEPEGVDGQTLIRKPLDLEKFLIQIRRIFESMPTRPASTAEASSPASTGEPVDLVLYVSAASAPSLRARRSMERLLERFSSPRLGFQVIDLATDAHRGEEDNIVFTPTLLKRRPEPRAWVLGDLGDPEVVTDLLHMCGIEPVR